MNETNKKRATIAIAIATAVALLLTGTYTWYAASTAVNEFTSAQTEKSVVLHDDFEEPIKEIYVENTSEQTPLYIRIKLNEFMDLTTNVAPPIIAWRTHIPKDESHVEDCGLTNDATQKFHDFFTWSMGGQKYYKKSSAGASGTAVSDVTRYTGSEENVQQTQAGTVISMAAYKTLPSDSARKAFFGWVYDTDGYAYWSQPLLPNRATAMLLNSVNKQNLNDMEYYYTIKVIMEAVNKADLAMWTVPSGYNDGLGKPSIDSGLQQTQLATQDAINLLNLVSSSADKDISSLSVQTQPSKTTYTVGETFDSSGLSITVHYEDGSTSQITDGYSYQPVGALTSTTTEVIISYGGKSVSIPITGHELRAFSNIKFLHGAGQQRILVFHPIDIVFHVVYGSATDCFVGIFRNNQKLIGGRLFMNDLPFDPINDDAFSQIAGCAVQVRHFRQQSELDRTLKPVLPFETHHHLTATDAGALSAPNGSATGQTKDILFPLSVSELNIYGGSNGFRKVAPLEKELGAFGYYGVRTPGNSNPALIYTSKVTTYCDTNGVIFQWEHTRVAELNHFMRPAMWITIPMP